MLEMQDLTHARQVFYHWANTELFLYLLGLYFLEKSKQLEHVQNITLVHYVDDMLAEPDDQKVAR
jgi:hypothetical protein